MRWIVGVALMVASPSAYARDYLTSVSSEVYQTGGTAIEIAARARVCMAQQLASGIVGGQVIISEGGGVIVANSALEYSDRMITWRLRSRLTFEARDGRFKIEQTGIERFGMSDWGPVGKWAGSRWQQAEAALAESAARVAACVQKNGKKDDW